MENKLARLLDYQKYEPNAKLASLISDVESKYDLGKYELSDDELGMVNAAGNASLVGIKDPSKDNKI